MSVTADLAHGVRRSDPRPSHCSACFRAAEAGVEFIDFDAAADRGSIVTDQGAIVGTLDDLHLCEACVRAGAQELNLKPDLHARQLREIRRLELAVEHWQSYAKRLEATLKDRPAEEPTRPAVPVRRTK